MRRSRWFALCLTLWILVPSAGAARSKSDAADGTLPRIAERTRGMAEHAGLLRWFADERAGKVWLEVPPPGQRGVAAELLYAEGLTTGLGSNPVGLDRGELGPTRWIALRRVGPRVLVEQLNPRFRAVSNDPDERRAVSESFATSVLWAGTIEAEDGDGRSLVDFTSFLVRDTHGIGARMKSAGQGEFALDAERSAVDLASCLAFPDNLEFEVLLTFSATAPGPLVRATAPDARSVTLVQHHSLIRLPDDGYRPREADPRAGSFTVGFQDYATELDEPLRRRWIVRHRLRRTDPAAIRSPAREPIVFYVDRGAPEPVRGALLDGAGWWAEAFDAAGFLDAFRVELLPEGLHPLDVRYNVIQWVHRSTRGWSYGGGVVDPRTGEMIKGHVRLGSLRVRQDRLLFEGLAGTDRTGSGAADDPLQLALARIRQLAAHEVGHALGLSHNFAASTYGGRASVLDYPAPLIGFDEANEPDFAGAYGVGVGAWDVHAIRYAYTEFAPGTDERAALAALVRQGLDAGLVYLTDADARPAGASDARASLWDNGNDPVAELAHVLRVRRHALDRFGERNVRAGTPLAHLEEVLAPVYFHHRYQLAATAKLVGGMEYHYAVRGDGQVPTRVVPAPLQYAALEQILQLLDPRELDLPDSVLTLLAPRPADEPRSREQFGSQTAPAFDVQQAAATAAAMALDALLQPDRLGRLAEFHRRDAARPGVDQLLDRLIARVFAESASGPPRLAELRRLVQAVLVDRMLRLGRDETLRPTIRARVEAAVSRILDRIETRRPPDVAAAQHAAWLGARITRFLDRPDAPAGPGWTAAPAPPGSPIGAAQRLAGCSGADGFVRN